MMAEQTAQVVSNQVKFNGNVSRVSSNVVAANPEAGVKTDEFTRTTFEDALDMASRPVRGKYADVPTSSEEFARRKQEEIDLEERQ